MTAALVITGIYMLVEITGGLLSGSLDLLADAGHMATDNTVDKPYYLTLHVTIEPNMANDTALQAIKYFVKKRFGIEHLAIQPGHDCCPDCSIHDY